MPASQALSKAVEMALRPDGVDMQSLASYSAATDCSNAADVGVPIRP